jgi:uncharacterized membrane protein
MSEHQSIAKTAKEAFSESALKHIADVIAEVEEHTSAEVRVSILDERPFEDGGLPLDKLALKEFSRLGMQSTKGQNGILLYILFEEHKYYICGDKGINDRVDTNTWEDVAATIKSHFKEGHFEEGVVTGLRTIKEHLRIALPPDTTNPNELPNEVILR